MPNSSPRSHIERNHPIPNQQADLTHGRHGCPEETECGSFLSPGVNASRFPCDTTVDLSSQEHRYSLSNLSIDLPLSNQSDLSLPAIEAEHPRMQPFKQLRAENIYLHTIISQQNSMFFQGHDSLAPAAPNTSSSTLLSGSGSNSPTLNTGTFPLPQVASNDSSEAGRNRVRLTSKPSRDSLPHVYQNHQVTLIPPSAGSGEIRRAISPDSLTNFPTLRSNSTVTSAQSRHGSRHPVGDLHERWPTLTSPQSMLSARPIRPLPSLSPSPAWSQESSARTHGPSNKSKITTHQIPQSHPNPNRYSSSQLKPPLGPMQRSVSSSTFRGSLDGNDSNNDDRDFYDDNQAYTSPVARSGKGKGKELDTAELAAQKRQMDEYPKEETRKGAVGGPRIPSACDACKQSKVRCVFPNRATKSGEFSDPIAAYLSSYNDSSSSQQLTKCERCALHGLDCRVSGRKKRDPPPSQSELERRNDYCSGQLLECLLQLIPASGNAIISANRRHTTEAPLPSSVPTSSTTQVPSTQTFMPRISSSGPRYPGPSNPYPQLNQALNLPSPSRSMPSLADLPPLPVLDKTTSRTQREAKIEKWIAEATERLIKFDYAQPLQAIPSRRGGDESGVSQWERGSQAQHEREYEEAWNDKTLKVDFGVNVEEMDEIEGNGDRVLDSDHMLHATRAYLFGERDGGSFEDIPQSRLPSILSKNVITSREATKLFDIFYDKMNMVFSACDPAIHTPVRVLQSSVFLFTTICAVASKHYTERPELYPVLLEYAKDAAGQAIHGPKTVETTQAFLLLGVHMPPSQTFIADRAYLFLGLAIRIAIDIELYRPQYTYEPPPDMPEDQARRLLNRGRTWLNCFCNDRSISTQMGKATAILIRGPPIPFNIKTWWCCSKWNLPSDIHMCAYADLLSVMADFHDVVYLDAYSADGRKKPLNLDLVQQYADKISAVQQSWTDIITSHFPNRADAKLAWRDNLWPFTSNYAKLVVLSIGLRNGMLQGLTDKNPFSEQSIAAACALLTQVLDKLANHGYMRYCVEAYFVFMGFAAAFLLKILRRKFSFMRKPGQDEEIISLVERLIALLGSDEVAIDNRHTPKLYSRYLGDILAQYKRTHMKERPEADPGDGPKLQLTPGSAKTNVKPNVQSHPNRAGVDTQPMEDIQTSLYSHSPMQSMGYSDPRLDASSYNGHSMGDASPAMDLDIPLPPSAENNQHTLLSMLPLEDPSFWDHLGMPLVTNPETWPQVVDMTHGTGAGLYNPLQVHNPFQNNQANYRTYGSGMGPSFSEQYYRQYH